MKRIVTALLVGMLGVMPVAAQSLQKMELQQVTPADQPYVIHVSDWLAQQPAAKQAVAEYHRLKAAGLLPTPNKTTQDPQIGDQETFKVFNFETGATDNINFELRVINDRFYIWLEVGNPAVTEDHMAELTRLMADETPENSFDPTKGIVELDEDIFGDPPDVDGDGRTDVLFLDIRDNYDPLLDNFGFIAGFVTGSDLTNVGNARDILYLDTSPSLTSNGGGFETIGSTAIHEYQHLIHLNYDTGELSLVNEGLSEWSEVAAGFEGRTINYLGSPLTYNVNLLRWSGNSDPRVFEDYQRGGLFSTYMAERMGVMGAGAITRSALTGVSGYVQALNDLGTGLTLESVLADFHVANYVNDTSVDPRYGYTYPQRVGVQVTPMAIIDGRTASETPSASTNVAPGAAQYIVWTNVSDFELSVNVTAGNPANSAARPHVVLTQNGQMTVQPVALQADPHGFNGDYSSIALVIPNTDPGGTFENIRYGAMWANEETFTAESVEYDNGQARDFVLSGGAELLTRFDNPSPGFGFLSRASVGVYYYSQFGNPEAPPPSAPRDFVFNIRAVAEDGTPGDVLFTQTLEDERGYAGVTSLALQFADVDLADFAEEMKDLPDAFFIGFHDTDQANDENSIIIATSPYSVESLSFIGPTQNGWTPLWNIELSDGTSLENTVIPIRAHFLVSSQPVSNEDTPELPQQVVLDQNYPNPFNPSTSIRYVLPQAGDVTLTVYDVLGRAVTTLFTGAQPAGAHTVELDASAWASGMYFYTLEANDQLQTRRMVLLK